MVLFKKMFCVLFKNCSVLVHGHFCVSGPSKNSTLFVYYFISLFKSTQVKSFIFSIFLFIEKK